MREIEAKGKKVDDAIKNGLEMLNATLDEVEVEILDQGGFFRKARVKLIINDGKQDIKAVSKESAEIPAKKEDKNIGLSAGFNKPVAENKKDTVVPPVKMEKKANPGVRPVLPAAEFTAEKGIKSKTENAEKFKQPSKRERPDRNDRADRKPLNPQTIDAAQSFLTEVLKRMGIAAELKNQTEANRISFDIVTEDTSVIGHKGEVLDALQILTKRKAETGEDDYIQVSVDCRGYREKRRDGIIALAQKKAQKCAETGKKVRLDPMPSALRRLVHAELAENDKVVTKSEGKEPYRCVIIYPKR